MWLFGWLGWLVGRLVAWLIDCWLAHRLSFGPLFRLACCRLVGNPVGSLVWLVALRLHGAGMAGVGRLADRSAWLAGPSIG